VHSHQPAADAPSRGHVAAGEALWFALYVGSIVFLIATLELLHDEAYYWLGSLYPDWSYFEYPPLISWTIALTQSWIAGEWGVRIAPFAAALAAAIWVSRTLIPPERRWAWWAGCLIFPLLSFMPSFALTDTVLLATASMFIWSMYRYILEDDYRWAALLGASAALMLYAKYQGVLLIAGMVIGVPELLKRWTLWFAAVIGGVLLIPHLHWQWQHHASTLAFHLFEAHRAGFSLLRPVTFLLLQAAFAGLLLAPWVWLQAWRGWRSSQFDRALTGMIVVTFGTFLVFSFTKHVLANWTLAGFLALLILVLRTSNELPFHDKWFRLLGGCSVALVLAVKIAVAVPATQYLVPRLGEVHGWRTWSREVANATPDCELVANRYQIAAKLSFYLKRQVLSLNINARPNQFDIWHFDGELRGKQLCWLTGKTSLPATELLTPEDKHLYLVRDVQLSTLLALQKTGPDTTGR